MSYANRALTPSEQQYAQIEKEPLTFVFGRRDSSNTRMEEKYLWKATTNP